MTTVKVSRATSCSRVVNYAEPQATIRIGISYDTDYAKSETKQTHTLHGRDNRVQAHLLIQSLQPGEVTAEKANQLEAEYAKEIVPNHQVAIYTHTGEDYIHNHIVVSSVSLEAGRKFQAHGQAFLDRCYDLNDEIYLEHDLTVTERGKETEERTVSEIKLKEKNESAWKDEVRFVIDQTMKNRKTRTYTRFCNSLKAFGIHCSNRGKDFIYELVHRKKKVRSNELEEGYEKETILHGLDRRERTYNQQRTNELRGA